MELFGHPAVLNLPSSDKGAAFYSALSPLLPPGTSGLPWKLNLTDAKVYSVCDMVYFKLTHHLCVGSIFVFEIV